VLPRRHILDVWEFTKRPEDLLPMSAATLAVDAIKYLNSDPKRDHLVETLEFNEFLCYMYPSLRPHNRSLLFHVVSDLVGLLLYGIPKKRRNSIESLEIIDYSTKNFSYPIVSVWNFLKSRVKTERTTDKTIIDGFINKIRIEVYILQHFPFVEDIFLASRSLVKEWVPSLSHFYRIEGDEIVKTYEQWSARWLSNEGKEKVIDAMIERLVLQAQRDYAVTLDKDHVKALIMNDPRTNKRHNDSFSKWYTEGVNILFRI
jgi:hypothetical protein